MTTLAIDEMHLVEDFDRKAAEKHIRAYCHAIGLSAANTDRAVREGLTAENVFAARRWGERFARRLRDRELVGDGPPRAA